MFVPSTREWQKIPASQITRGPNTTRLSCPSKATTISGSSDGRNTNEGIAELKDSESIPSLALSVRPIYYEEVPNGPHSTF